MSWSSSVPAAIDGLVTACRAADGLATVSIQDGPQIDGSGVQEALWIGYQTDDSPISAEGLGENSGMDVRQTREQYSINCAVAVMNGGGDLSAARARAYALVGEVGAILAADQSLGGAVMQCRIASSSMTQSRTKQGAKVYVQFGVECDAFTSL